MRHSRDIESVPSVLDQNEERENVKEKARKLAEASKREAETETNYEHNAIPRRAI